MREAYGNKEQFAVKRSQKIIPAAKKSCMGSAVIWRMVFMVCSALMEQGKQL